MKIPETPANIGAYYGNEENGQWQPNGVIIDGGMGGGVVGSGDAGVHRPSVYPVHMPRGPLPGYVMAGAYYPPGAAYPPVPAPPQDDFADYMWMENEEEFDKQVMQQLEEEALMEQCIEAMLEDEQRERVNSGARQHPRQHAVNGHNNAPHYPTTSNNGPPSLSLEETVSRSTLNPLAAEFVPTRGRQGPQPIADEPTKQEQHSTEVISSTTNTATVTTSEEVTTQSVRVDETVSSKEQPVECVHRTVNQVTSEISEKTTRKEEGLLSPPKDPPEVSAADVQPIQEARQPVAADRRTPKEPKRGSEARRSAAPVTPKVDAKAKKPVAVKSDTKLTPKKRDAKVVKSEVKIDDKTEEDVVVVVAPVAPVEGSKVAEESLTSNQPQQQQQTQPAIVGPKPINYAAAAKANKPRKPSTVPSNVTATSPCPNTATVDKSHYQQKKIVDRKEKKIADNNNKPQNVVVQQRKNSAK